MFQDPNVFALAAVLACVWGTLIAAAFIANGSARILTAFALFGLAWAVLVPYYLPPVTHHAWLEGFHGFLLVYVGALLCWEACVFRGAQNIRVGLAEKWPLSLLVAMVVQPTYSVLSTGKFTTLEPPTPGVSWLSTVLTVLGLASLWTGFFRLFQCCQYRRARLAVSIGLALLIVPYCVVGVGFSIRYHLAYNAWAGSAPILRDAATFRFDMPVEYKQAFAVFKLVLTASFILLMALRPTRKPRPPMLEVIANWLRRCFSHSEDPSPQYAVVGDRTDTGADKPVPPPAEVVRGPEA